MPSGNQPLPDRMLTKFYDDIWHLKRPMNYAYFANLQNVSEENYDPVRCWYYRYKISFRFTFFSGSFPVRVTDLHHWYRISFRFSVFWRNLPLTVVDLPHSGLISACPPSRHLTKPVYAIQGLFKVHHHIVFHLHSQGVKTITMIEKGITRWIL